MNLKFLREHFPFLGLKPKKDDFHRKVPYGSKCKIRRSALLLAVTPDRETTAIVASLHWARQGSPFHS